MAKKQKSKSMKLSNQMKQAKRAYEAAPKKHKLEAKKKMESATNVYEAATANAYEIKQGSTQLSKSKDRRDPIQKVKDLVKRKKRSKK